MSNRQTEERIRRAFEGAAPNNLDTVKEKCEKQKGIVITMESRTNKKGHRILRSVMAAAAALVLAVTAGEV